MTRAALGWAGAGVLVALGLAPLPVRADETAASGIEGQIVDAETRRGLVEAPVLVGGEEGSVTALTDAAGRYRVLVPPGRYTLRSFYDLYQGARLDGVRVRGGTFTTANLALTPIRAEDVVVEELEVFYRADTTTAAAQDQLRRAGGGIGEGLGAAQMSQQGAGDAGGAASRVVGVSVDEGQLVVRGLGGRYTRVLLNGEPVPSTDPDRPGADLDLFPASVIDSLTISKAFLPDMPADFAGGLMMIKSVSFPRAFTLELGVETGGNTQSTFRDRLDYHGGRLDGLGVDDGSRALPGGIPRERVTLSRSGRYQTLESIEDAGERFRNTWQWRRTHALPRLGVDLVLGDSLGLGGPARLGYLLTLGYGYESVRQTGTSRPRPTLTADGSLAPFNDYRVEWGSDEVALSALGTVSLELGRRHSFTVLSLLHRSMTDETQRQTGESGELAAGETVERWQLQFLARTLWLNQLLGDHPNLAGTRLRLQWSAFASLGRRDEPDRRSVTYGPQGGSTRWLEKAGSGERFWSDLTQVDFGGSMKLRLPLWTEGWATAGGSVRTSGRALLNRRFRMLQDPAATDQSAFAAPPEELFGEEGVGALTRIRELTRADDSYTSRQDLLAGFLMLESPLVGPLSVTGGARLEAFAQHVASTSPFDEDVAESERAKATDRTDLDVLPGGSVKLDLGEAMVLRAAYGLTVARPQVRELAPYQYYDFLRDRNVQGNPDLARSRIHNADLRWEWFFGEGEILAATFFGKYFRRPIELQILNPVNYDAQFINAESGRALGAELELRVGLRRLAAPLAPFSLAANGALVWSRVELPPELSGAVSDDRPMFGQSPYVANLSLRYDAPATGVGVGLVYNVVGPRISDVGTRVNERILPDIEEEPFHALDLVARWGIGEHIDLKLKVKNLLLEAHDFRQGDFLTQRVEPGMSFTLGLAYTH